VKHVVQAVTRHLRILFPSPIRLHIGRRTSAGALQDWRSGRARWCDARRAL